MKPDKNIVVVKRRLDLYIDFIINLTHKIHLTHPGLDCLYEDEDINNHYNWCFNLICEDFLEQSVNFKNNNDVKKNLYDFLYKNLYKVDNIKDLTYYLKLWKTIFSDKNKDINTVHKIYENFDKTLA